MKLKLSKRQFEILEFINQYISSNGYPPTIREIGRGVNLSSSSTIHFHLNKLEKLKYIERESGKTRAITVLS